MRHPLRLFRLFRLFRLATKNDARTPGWNGIRSGQGVYIGVSGGACSASSMSARLEGGFYLPGPLNTRVGVDAQGKTGGEPVGVLGFQAGYEWKRQTFGPWEWALKPAAELEGIYIGQQSPVGDMPINPSVLGTQYVTLPMTVGVVLAKTIMTSATMEAIRCRDHEWSASVCENSQRSLQGYGHYKITALNTSKRRGNRLRNPTTYKPAYCAI